MLLHAWRGRLRALIFFFFFLFFPLSLSKYDLLHNRKLCGCCRKTRFNLLTRAKECQMCGRPACKYVAGATFFAQACLSGQALLLTSPLPPFVSACIMRISIPPHMLEPPGGQGRHSPKTPPKSRSGSVSQRESAADVLSAANAASAASAAGVAPESNGHPGGSPREEHELETSPPRPGTVAASAAAAVANVTSEARRGRPILLCTLCRSSLGGARLPLRKGTEG